MSDYYDDDEQRMENEAAMAAGDDEPLVDSAAFPDKLKPHRARMDEPSYRRDLDLKCHCGQTLYYLGIKYSRQSIAGIVGYDDDGEAILGDRHFNAPYAYWRCVNGHQETDGY